jgi:hypothetical protein
VFSSNDDADDRDIEGKSFLLLETSERSARARPAGAGQQVPARNAADFTVATDLETTSTEESVSAGLGDGASTAGNESFTVSIASLDFLGFRARSFVGYQSIIHQERKGKKGKTVSQKCSQWR